MIDTRDARRGDDRSGGENRMLREVHSAAIPPAEPRIDTGTLALRAEQEAGRLVASGALDPDTVVAGVDPLTGEAAITARAELDLTEVEKERLAAAQRGLVNIVVAYDGDFTPPREGAEGSLEDAENALRDAEGDASAAETAATAAIVELREATPARATRESAAATIRWWWWLRIVLPTAIVGALELVATANAVYVFMRLDDWVAAFVVAASTLVGLTLAPTLAGIHAAEWREVAGRSGWRLAGMVTLIALWVMTAVSLAIVRVLTAQEMAAREEAAGNSLDEQAAALGVDTATSAAGAASYPGFEILFWIVVLLVMGGFLFFKETFAHRREAAQRAELIARVNLWEAKDVRKAWRGRVVAILNQVAIQKADLQTVDAIYVTESHRIRSRAEFEKSRYRNELVVVAADPEMTSALEVRFARSRRPDAFRAPALVLPAWATSAERPDGRPTPAAAASAADADSSDAERGAA